MKTNEYISSWIKRFLIEYLVTIRSLSINTRKSYRDTFRLVLSFISNKVGKSIERLNIEDIDAATIKSFLSIVEKSRNCSISTRNQRLSAIHAFAKFIGAANPEHLEWSRQILMIPFKKAEQKSITYLEKDEMNALLSAPRKQTKIGHRDYVLLLFLYNTGARAEEAAQCLISDLSTNMNQRNKIGTVLLKGKGNKSRHCPLWKQTEVELNAIILSRAPEEHVFMNKNKVPLTRFGIYGIVKKYAKVISENNMSLQKKEISPHTIRHTTASHLLQAGVDINTIRGWLGHVSLDTTNRYAEVNIEMKNEALKCCSVKTQKGGPSWNKNKSIMDFLNSL